MQRGSNIKVNGAGLGSCLLLLLLAFLALQPIVGVAAYAEEVEDDGEDAPAVVEAGSSSRTYLTSEVGIALTPTVASATVTPIDGNEIPVYADVVATVTLKNTGGYQVYLGSTNTDNYLRNGEHYIAPISDNNAYALDEIPENEWGYSFTEGKTADHEHYKTVPLATREGVLARGADAASANATYALSFAANIDANMPSGTYSNSVTLSVVSSPREVSTDFGIATMQEMTSTVCANAKDNDGDSEIAGQLRDVRDGKYYWVGKMPDGRCWMTQNLDLDLFTDVELKGDTTNLSGGASATWKPTRSTTTDASKTYAGNTEQYSWSMGGPVVKPANYSTTKPTDYYTTNPDSTTSCGNQLASVASCNSGNASDQLAKGGWTQMDVPLEADGTNAADAHRLIGNLYQWCAATAGCVSSSDSSKTGSNFTSGEAASSICPYGWKLPTGNANGDLQKLTNALGAPGGSSSVVKNLTDAPFYAVRGGYFYQADDIRFSAIGSSGKYWSSTGSSTNAHDFYFYSTGAIYPTGSSAREFGFPVRCINNPNI